MTPLLWAKVAAVLSVVYGGTNLYQLFAKLADVQTRARQFTEVAGAPEHAARLRAVRLFFYLGAPLGYLSTLYGAQLRTDFLIAIAVKFWVSALLGLGMERRLLQGKEYSGAQHWLARADAALNLLFTVAAIALLLRRRY